MTWLLRNSKFVNASNCSSVQIRESKVYVFQTELYYTVNPDSEIDYSHDKVPFYVVEGIHSLNQSVDNPKPAILHLPINLAFEIFDCFKELEIENVERVKRLFK